METPTKGIWNRFLLLIPLLLVLAVTSYAYIRSKAGTLVLSGYYWPDEHNASALIATPTTPGVIEVDSVKMHPSGLVTITMHAVGDGATEVLLESAGFEMEAPSKTLPVEVHDGIVVEGGINFEGWGIIHASLVVLLAALAALFASAFVKLWRVSWYGYTMVASGGGFVFCFFQFLFFLSLLIWGNNPEFYFFLQDIAEMPTWFAAVALFPMLPLAVLVSLSNIALIRHEGRRPINLLGVAASVVWLGAYAIWYMWSASWSAVSLALSLLVSTAIAFGECLLLSIMLCAWLATCHEPKHGMDYLVVLGCGIHKDGTPSPLLAGRVDRAFAFDQARQEQGDPAAVFVPSGGQGPDEPCSEAESMGEYLVSRKGVERERIALEDRSTTTRENMAFSREVIERHAGRDANELRVGFSTTNYHVFRGYVCAHQAGMRVEGIGSKTKYYFWPNAFLREFVGLLAAQWQSLLQTYLIIAAIYLIASYIVRSV